MSDTKAPQKTPFPEKELWHETRGRIKEEAVVRANKRWGVSDNEAFVTELLSAQIASLNTENGALKAAVERVRALHNNGVRGAYECAECRNDYPCPTLRALADITPLPPET